MRKNESLKGLSRLVQGKNVLGSPINYSMFGRLITLETDAPSPVIALTSAGWIGDLIHIQNGLAIEVDSSSFVPCFADGFASGLAVGVVCFVSSTAVDAFEVCADPIC